MDNDNLTPEYLFIFNLKSLFMSEFNTLTIEYLEVNSDNVQNKCLILS